MSDIIAEYVKQPDAALATAIGCVLLLTGYWIAWYGAAALGFILGLVFGVGITVAGIYVYEPSLTKQWWWIPLAVGGVCGLAGMLFMHRAARVFTFLACFAAGLLVKLLMLPDRWVCIAGGVDVSPLIAGAALGLTLFLLRGPMIIILTSITGATMIVAALDLKPDYLWYGLALGLIVQFGTVYYGRRRRATRRQVNNETSS